MGRLKVTKLLAIAVAGLSIGLLLACGGSDEKAVVEEPTRAAAPEATATPGAGLGKLAYVRGGDIWVQPLPDGELQRLTTDSVNSEPRWSPSGRWLTFRKGNEFWVMPADGSEGRRLNAAGAVWAPAADRLAYVDDTAALVVEDADGSQRREIVAPGIILGPSGVAWSPDGEWLAYVEQRVEEGRTPGYTHAGVWRVRADGSDAAELYSTGTPPKDGVILAGWSPDGQYVLFWRQPHFSASAMASGLALYAIPPGGGGPRELGDQGMLLHSDFRAPSPVGDLLVITEGSGRMTWSNKRIALVDVAGGTVTALTGERAAAFSPAWSPDGERIAYVAMPDEGDLGGGEGAREGLMQRRIFVVDTQGEPRPGQLAEDPAYRDERPLWSADGAFILFARINAEDTASLWLVPAQGGEPRRIVDGLTPEAEPARSWIGYYGHVGWDMLFDWWRGPA